MLDLGLGLELELELELELAFACSETPSRSPLIMRPSKNRFMTICNRISIFMSRVRYRVWK